MAQDILESGKGEHNDRVYQEIIVIAADRIRRTDTIAEIEKNAVTIDLSREVLRPLSLSGKEQIEDRLNLIFTCINHAISLILSTEFKTIPNKLRIYKKGRKKYS